MFNANQEPNLSIFERIYIFIYHYFQKTIRNNRLRNYLAKLEAMTRPPKTRELSSQKSKILYRELKDLGHTSNIEPLNAIEVKEMRDYFIDKEMFEYRSDNPNAYTYKDVPKDWSTAIYPIETLLKAPHLFKVANNPDILATLENIFGCKPEIGVMQAMWRFPTDNPAVFDELWHRDFETLRLIKCFLYLTDVDEKSAPHKFIETSHLVNRKTRVHWSFEGDESLEKAYGEEKIVMKEGPAGTCFLEETIGWHKGLKPVNKSRLMVQIVYSVNPVRYKDRKPIPEEEIMELNGVEYDAYTFRNHIIPSTRE